MSHVFSSAPLVVLWAATDVLDANANACARGFPGHLGETVSGVSVEVLLAALRADARGHLTDDDCRPFAVEGDRRAPRRGITGLAAPDGPSLRHSEHQDTRVRLVVGIPLNDVRSPECDRTPLARSPQRSSEDRVPRKRHEHTEFYPSGRRQRKYPSECPAPSPASAICAGPPRPTSYRGARNAGRNWRSRFTAERLGVRRRHAARPVRAPGERCHRLRGRGCGDGGGDDRGRSGVDGARVRADSGLVSRPVHRQYHGDGLGDARPRRAPARLCSPRSTPSVSPSRAGLKSLAFAGPARVFESEGAPRLRARHVLRHISTANRRHGRRAADGSAAHQP